MADAPAVDVSVVVPTYNTGHYLEPCVDSLLAQTLPADRLQLIFVDDGSTDDTPRRLDELAAAHEQVTVIHMPPSGWPGKPRNTGIDAARGEYLYFVDHDDVLGPQALEDLVATARRTGADIVLGKMIGMGRDAPFAIFRRNIDDARLDEVPLMSSMTPHKLFRTDFLRENDIRFPEGKRRLEDTVFVTKAYLAAKKISVFSDRVCYFHTKREDRANAAFEPPEPSSYFGYLREAIEVIEAQTEPGAFRDRLLSRFLVKESLRKLTEPRVQRWEPDYLASLVHEIQRLVEDHYPESSVAKLPPIARARTAAVRAGSVEDILAIADCAAQIDGHVDVESFEWAAGGWQVSWSAWLAHSDGSPLVAERRPDGLHLDPRLVPDSAAIGPLSEDDLLVHADAVLVLRHLGSWTNWTAPADMAAALEPVPGSPDRVHVVLRGRSTIDPRTVAGGEPLSTGQWRVLVRITTIGLKRTVPVVLPALPERALIGKPAVAVVPNTDDHGRLRLRVIRGAGRLPALLDGARVTGGSVTDAGLVLDFDHATPVVGKVLLPCRARLQPRQGAPITAAARATPRALVIDLGDAKLPHGPLTVEVVGGKGRVLLRADLTVRRRPFRRPLIATAHPASG
ncbi:MAG TPA: glycosyltransferase family 2 protein [Mycobacteriales bacterium]|nr:glycosyltransferase family 2 protein [Mycobacteriales bacterium]